MHRFLLAAAAACIGWAPAWSEETAVDDDASSVTEAPEESESDRSARAKEARAFTVPPGYKPKRRGRHVIYCKKTQEIGTRFATERCYDETQLREIARQHELDQTVFDQTRKICSNPEACGGG